MKVEAQSAADLRLWALQPLDMRQIEAVALRIRGEAFGLDVVIGVAGHLAAVLNKDQVRHSDRLTCELQVRVQALVCLAINLPAGDRHVAAPAQRVQRTAGMRIQVDRARYRQT